MKCPVRQWPVVFFLAGCGDPSSAGETDIVASEGDDDDGGDDATVDEDRPPPPSGCGDGVLEGVIYLERGPEELDRLDGIGTVTGDVVIDKTDVASLEGFECLIEIGGNLHIFGNAQLTDLHGLDNLWRVHGHVVISENHAIEDLDALTGLRFVGTSAALTSVTIRHNDGLRAIGGLSSLKVIRGNLIIQLNDLLQHIDGLTDLRVVDGLFGVTKNPSLCLSSINTVGERLTQSPAPGSSTQDNDPDC
jgi:hypothetical protein